MRIYLKIIAAKLHPDSMWNDGSLIGLFLKSSPQKEEEEQDE